MSQPFPPYPEGYSQQGGYSGGYQGGYPGGYPMGTNPGMPPDNNLVWAILATIFCFLPLGVVAIIKSTEVNSKWAMGDYAGAQMSLDESKKWTKWSVIVSVIIYGGFALVYFIGLVAMVGVSSSVS